MYQPLALYIGLRYMCRQVSNGRFISLLSTIGIILGVMALVTILSIMNGFERVLENNVLRFIPQALLTTKNGCLNPLSAPFFLKEDILKDKGVIGIAPFTTGDVILQSPNSFAMGIILGINSSDSEPLANYLVDTHISQLSPGKYHIILGQKLADKLGVKYNDKIRIIVPSVSQFTPLGRIPSQRLFTVIGTYITNSEVDQYQILVNQQDASHLMHYPSGYVTGWRLWLQQPLKVDSISKIQCLPNELIWKDWRERKSELFHAIHMEKNIMGLLLSLIVVVAAFNILTSLCMIVREKKSEVAIFATQGLQFYQIMPVFMIQGVSAGIIGALVGAILGVLLANTLNYFPLFHNNTLPINIEPLQIVTIIILTTVLAWLSTIYPSWCAVTKNVVELLRDE
uniref:Lipoprotein releasing system, transmembrane protein LolC n=1 Tax=Baumannia cicadellinicola subsp. Homalodisca coagulata TaxID=374463 RepID=Q1LT47_BAUCH